MNIQKILLLASMIAFFALPSLQVHVGHKIQDNSSDQAPEIKKANEALQESLREYDDLFMFMEVSDYRNIYVDIINTLLNMYNKNDPHFSNALEALESVVKHKDQSVIVINPQISKNIEKYCEVLSDMRACETNESLENDYALKVLNNFIQFVNVKNRIQKNSKISEYFYVIFSILDTFFLMVTTLILSYIFYLVLFNPFSYKKLLTPAIDHLSEHVRQFKNGTWLQQFYKAYTSIITRKMYPFFSAFCGVVSVSLALLLPLKPKDSVAPVSAAKYTFSEFTFKISRLINFWLSYLDFWHIFELAAEKWLTILTPFFGDQAIENITLKPLMSISNLFYSALALLVFYKNNDFPKLSWFISEIRSHSKPENTIGIFDQLVTFFHFVFLVIHLVFDIGFILVFELGLSLNFVSETIFSILFLFGLFILF